MSDEAPAGQLPVGDRRRPARHWLLLVFRAVLGGVFLFSACAKIMEPRILSYAIMGFGVIPASYALEAAVLLIWYELICGLFMLLGLWTRATTIVLFGMLCAFEVGIVSVLWRGIEINCGCFGTFFEEAVTWKTAIRNLLLIAMTVSLFFLRSWKWSLDLVIKVHRRVKAGGPGWRQ